MVSMIVISKYGRTSELCSDGRMDTDAIDVAMI